MPSHDVSPGRRVLSLEELIREHNSEYHAWWEDQVAEAAGVADHSAYHTRTRIAGKVGLLVDPGAHDNLIGGHTCELMRKQLQSTAKERKLDRPLVVSGVGKGQRPLSPCRVLSRQ